MKLLAIVQAARANWSPGTESEYICDCICAIEDSVHCPVNYDYPLSTPLLEFVADKIEHKFSAKEYLFGNGYRGSATQERALREFREALWDALTAFAIQRDGETNVQG